jgi:hypothetical protein
VTVERTESSTSPFKIYANSGSFITTYLDILHCISSRCLVISGIALHELLYCLIEHLDCCSHSRLDECPVAFVATRQKNSRRLTSQKVLARKMDEEFKGPAGIIFGRLFKKISFSCQRTSFLLFREWNNKQIPRSVVLRMITIPGIVVQDRRIAKGIKSHSWLVHTSESSA